MNKSKTHCILATWFIEGTPVHILAHSSKTHIRAYTRIRASLDIYIVVVVVATLETISDEGPCLRKREEPLQHKKNRQMSHTDTTRPTCLPDSGRLHGNRTEDTKVLPDSRRLNCSRPEEAKGLPDSGRLHKGSRPDK